MANNFLVHILRKRLTFSLTDRPQVSDFIVHSLSLRKNPWYSQDLLDQVISVATEKGTSSLIALAAHPLDLDGSKAAPTVSHQEEGFAASS